MTEPSPFFVTRIATRPKFELQILDDAILSSDLDRIKSLFSEKEFLTAIYLSSKSLYAAALSWINNPGKTLKENDRVLTSLYKYYSRYCVRPTPYGLFGAFSLGRITDHPTNLILSDDYRSSNYRTDLTLIRKLKENLFLNDADKLFFKKNNSIYRFGAGYRYMELEDNKNFNLAEFASNDLIDKVLFFLNKKRSKKSIVHFVEQLESEIPHEEIVSFVNNLIDSKILVVSDGITLTATNDPADQIITNFREHGIETDSFEKVLKVKENLTISNTIRSLETLSEKLEQKDKDIRNPSFFLVDLKAKFDHIQINSALVKTLIKRGNELSHFCGPNVHPRLKKFREDFVKRFDQQEVELAVALDPDLGVGYDTHVSGNIEPLPLLDNLIFTLNKQDSQKDISTLLLHVFDKYSEHFSENSTQVVKLTNEDIATAGNTNVNITFAANSYFFGSFIRQNYALDTNNFKFFPKSTFPSPLPINILSRFTSHDKELKEAVSNLTEEDGADYVFAEVIHMPNDKVGNVLIRPNFYKHQISYISDGDDSVNQIYLNDLLVCVRNGNVLLRSKNLNKQVIPRMTTAYNYDSSQLSFIKFLGDLQYQGINMGFQWNWKGLNDLNFLPRIEYKEIILCEARWRLYKDPNLNMAKLKLLLLNRKVPESFTIKIDDQVLLLNASNNVCLQILHTELKRRDLLLYEYLPSDVVLSSKGDLHNAEFIFPVVQENAQSIRLTKFSTAKGEDIKRLFLPGEEWFYFKIYCSPKVGDDVITDVIDLIIEKIFSQDENVLWHFIRYKDPESHIRFRIRTESTMQLLEELNELLIPYNRNRLVFRVQLDTYIREVERYGVNNIELSEQVFCHDSKSVIEFLSLVGSEGEDIRWKGALISIDQLMNDFDLSNEDKLEIVNIMFLNFLPEFIDMNNPKSFKIFKRSIDQEFRAQNKFIEDFIAQRNEGPIKQCLDIFSKRSFFLRQISGGIKNNFTTKTDFFTVIQSYIHMNLNRIFFTNSRAYELAVYYFLKKCYTSISKRNGKEERYI